MQDNLELVARPKGVLQTRMDNGLDWRTDRESGELSSGDRPLLANRFDHSSTLPRKASLSDISRCRLYFIAGAGLIKIGISTNLQSRFRAIRNSSPVPVELLGSCPGTTFFEGMLHRKFAHLRRHGEWFEDTPELRAEIAWRIK